MYAVFRVIMRSFYSGRRFSCLEVLLALFLSAPISLNAQSGSSPQSQPAQSPPPRQPPPTQSQAQSTPPCSDGRPILKRGTQPALPPCPDPPPDASPPADSAPTRSLNPSETLIERAREAAFEFSEKLPNFICQEVMSRFTQRGRERKCPWTWFRLKSFTMTRTKRYRNVKINDRPTDRGLQEIGGSWSTGEFASTLLEPFSPRYGRAVPVRRRVFHFGFQCPGLRLSSAE